METPLTSRIFNPQTKAKIDHGSTIYNKWSLQAGYTVRVFRACLILAFMQYLCPTYPQDGAGAEGRGEAEGEGKLHTHTHYHNQGRLSRGVPRGPKVAHLILYHE